MKSLLKIISRYSVMAGLIVIVLLISNVLAFIYWGYTFIEGGRSSGYGRKTMDAITVEVKKEEEGYVLSQKGREKLKASDFVWVMALDEEGQSVWGWEVPEEIPDRYSVQDVASFARWYICDYPVRTWTKGELLFVFACDKERVARYSEMIELAYIDHLPDYFKTVLVVNLVVIALVILGYGYRFYRAMRPVAEGIEKMSREEPVRLREKGIAGELAEKLNLASRMLEEKSRKLEKRDEARTEWIAGVSHDIRTPLSLIVGYSDELAKDGTLGEENRKRAEIIRRQSLIIRQLISDLNLTSKLAYHAQPLKKTKVSPAVLIRECVADFYNEGLDETYEIEVLVEEEAEKIRTDADENLLKRALRNLVGNSIRHNPAGCRVMVSLSENEGRISCLVEDTGKGIPEIVVKDIDNSESEVHIMGLRLVDQIAQAHGGGLVFVERESGGYDAGFLILSQS